MKAIVFAAGVGSRLKPFTDFHPKALAPLGGVPVLGRVLGKLAAAGADAAVVNIHHFPNQIRQYLDCNDFGLHVEISDESSLLLDTAGALAKIVRESETIADMGDKEEIILHNADIFTDFRISAMLDRHRAADADATLLVDSTRVSSRAFLFDHDGRLRGWRNTSAGITRPSGLKTDSLIPAAFGGVHIINRYVLDRVSSFVGSILRPCSIVDFYVGNCGELNIRNFTPSEPYSWHDIGTAERLAAAEAEFTDCKD